ncbi:MAG: hypothetical protein JF606_24435 [Burkholderiales bacterium]|nr:hypothetical protein [Burkholderiales bacterium]
MKTVMAVACALSASLASAHNLWIEPTSSDMQAVYDSMVHRATLSFTTPEGAVFENPRPAQYQANDQ